MFVTIDTWENSIYFFKNKIQTYLHCGMIVWYKFSFQKEEEKISERVSKITLLSITGMKISKIDNLACSVTKVRNVRDKLMVKYNISVPSRET